MWATRLPCEGANSCCLLFYKTLILCSLLKRTLRKCGLFRGFSGCFALKMVHKKRIQGEQSGTFALEVLHFRFFLINYSGVFAVPKLIGGGCFDVLLCGDFWEVWHGIFSFPGQHLDCAPMGLNYPQTPAATCGGADARHLRWGHTLAVRSQGVGGFPLISR